MDAEKWGIVFVTAGIAAAFVVLLIIIINTVGKRGQAITWLPASLATILALQYSTDPTKLNTILKAAYASQIISASFIIVFYAMILNKYHTIALWSTVSASVILPAVVVWFICHYLNPFWAFFTGTLGNVLIIFFLRIAPPLEFHQQEFNLSCKKFRCDCTEAYILIASMLGTIIFVVIPAILSDLGYVDIAGIISNAPKISFFIMLNLWVQNKGCCVHKDIKNEKAVLHELKEHLTMFAYSTGITTIFLVVIWFNENEQNPENFWWAWGAAFLLSMAVVAGVLIPLCFLNKGLVKQAPSQFELNEIPDAPKGEQKEPSQGNLMLKW